VRGGSRGTILSFAVYEGGIFVEHSQDVIGNQTQDLANP
jgi:hypothetical protein